VIDQVLVVVAVVAGFDPPRLARFAAPSSDNTDLRRLGAALTMATLALVLTGWLVVEVIVDRRGLSSPTLLIAAGSVATLGAIATWLRSGADQSQESGQLGLMPLAFPWAWRPELVLFGALVIASRQPIAVAIGILLGGAFFVYATQHLAWRSVWVSRWLAGGALVAGLDLIYDGVLSV